MFGLEKKMTKAREIHRRNKGVENYTACAKCFLPREHESFEVVKINGRNIEIDRLKNRDQNVSISKKYK